MAADAPDPKAQAYSEKVDPREDSSLDFIAGAKPLFFDGLRQLHALPTWSVTEQISKMSTLSVCTVHKFYDAATCGLFLSSQP